MGASWIVPIITSIIGTGINLAARSGGPSYPSPPKLFKLPVQQAKKQMEDYEATRMQASIDAWKTKFPDLYKGGAYEIGTILQQQQGLLGGTVNLDMQKAGLGSLREGDQYRLSQDMGLSPITLSQRTSQAVTRQIAQNPEWTNQITGGTLATMLANNYQNQQAYTQFLGANQMAQYAAKQGASAYNTAAVLSGVTNTAGLLAQHYSQQQYGPTSPAGQGIYQGAGMQQQAAGGGAGGPPAYNPWQAPGQYGTSMTGPYANSYQYGNFYTPGNMPSPMLGPFSNQYPTGVDTSWNTMGAQYYNDSTFNFTGVGT